MKTLILGGGVVGVTTAYFLAKAGHEVTIVEEKDGLGLEATAGNAGIIARPVTRSRGPRRARPACCGHRCAAPRRRSGSA